MISEMEDFKILPFKSINEKKVKATRKRSEIDIICGDYFPPEGHCAILICEEQLDDELMKSYLYFGGSRHTEESTWCLGSSPFIISYVISENDVVISDIKRCDTFGASFPSLASSSVIVGSNDTIHVWGGMDTSSMRVLHDLYLLKRKGAKFEVILAQDSKDERNVTKIKQTGDVPLGRFGHSLTKLHDQSAILHGGITLPFREAAGLASPFQQTCDDGKFYLLNLDSLSWSIINVPDVHSRAFHTATYDQKMKCIYIIGGVTYQECTPRSRLPVHDVLVLRIPDKNNITLDRIIFQSPPNIENLGLSYHSACLEDGKVIIVGGFTQIGQFQADEKPDLNPCVLLVDLNFKSILSVDIGSDNLTAGNSLLCLSSDCFLSCGGVIKSYFVYTTKAMKPSPCDLQTKCLIDNSPEISPISWIQCEGTCKRWLHQFCIGLLNKDLPKGKYNCPDCKTTNVSRKRKSRK